MSKKIDLSRFPCFSAGERIERLNYHIKLNRNLMPHEIAVVSGCDLEEAMQVLMLLFSMRHADGYLLVYHEQHPNVPILMREFEEGFPSVPFDCPICEEEIEHRDQLLYDFLFKVHDDVEFEVADHEHERN